LCLSFNLVITMSKKTPLPTPQQIAAGNRENFLRALEIALSGKYPLHLLVAEDYTTGIQDAENIKRVFNVVDYNTDGLCVEICQAQDWYKLGPISLEMLQDIYKRVNQSNIYDLPTEIDDPHGVCMKLLDSARRHLHISDERVEFITNVSKTIARLSGSPVIRTEHWAEAIQYATTGRPSNKLVSVEDNAVQFGPHIKISRLELRNSDIEAAISYLQSRLI
jgi:hypothetical protein